MLLQSAGAGAAVVLEVEGLALPLLQYRGEYPAFYRLLPWQLRRLNHEITLGVLRELCRLR